ncbi:2-isopropylmalate synthase [Corynebacterium glyciniphilum]|uniref:2-isopropylmalate synthase n=1 Tax=Corynebacterium glyciniphilum TaxID=1404244 RepID=UPI003FD51318
MASTTKTIHSPSPMPSHRYRDVYSRVSVPLADEDRTWPTRRLTTAPLWVPVDLRDGNQALAEPMDPVRKRRFFELMVSIGYKEIEVGYPSASQTDYDFVRLIADTDIAPDDVTIVVFTPARRDLIERTIAAIQGITNPVVIHMYTATAPLWRDLVLGRDRADLKDLILSGGRDVLNLAGDMDNVRFEFSPEVFNQTEPDYVLDLCDSMTQLWDASSDRPVILNLPATVEIASPNVYADQIEYMSRNLARRDNVILSVHPHNDRGAGVACAELAVLAGAERVEGCIFGNGERTGNVDIATLALNLHAQGIDPEVDFSDIDRIRSTVEYCTRMEVHPRHPYVGDLVHTAFSGTHQDAIRKGFIEHRARAARDGQPEDQADWHIPYLPIDPADIGRNYDAVIRVNSQSGKGGIAYLLSEDYGVELPRRLQIDLAAHVQRHTDDTGAEVTADHLWEIFASEYLSPVGGRIGVVGYQTGDDAASPDGATTTIQLRIDDEESTHTVTGCGPVEALVTALAEVGVTVEVIGLSQTSVTAGSGSDALTLLEFRSGGKDGKNGKNGKDTVSPAQWVAGRDSSVLAASMNAVVAAANKVV